MNKQALISITVILVLTFAFVTPAHASSATVIRPSANGGWGILPNGDVAVTTNNAIGSVVSGPGGQPGGLLPGSVEYHTNSAPGGKPQLYAPAALTGVKFTDLTALTYLSYISAYANGGAWLTHTVNVKIDLDGDLVGTPTDRATMVFEPCYTVNFCTGPIQPLNTWATWDALAPGAIWWSTASIPGTAFVVPFNSFAPLTSLYTAYPNARIMFLEIQAGQGSGGPPWNNFVGNLDGVTIGVQGVSTTYDFEPDLPSPKAIKAGVLAQLTALRGSLDPSLADKHDFDKLDEAIKHLTKSLDDKLWVDETHLQAKHGEKVFNEEKDAVVKLLELLKDKKSTVDKLTLQDFINRLVDADKTLATVAYNDAVAAGGDAKKIAKANEELNKGDARALDGKFVDAIEHYRNAWKHAIKAV